MLLALIVCGGIILLNIPQKYYFGRLNIITSNPSKVDFITKGLGYEGFLDIRNFKWAFFNIEKFTQDTGDYFTGYLAKYRPLTDEETADENSHKIVIEEAERRISAKARFFLHIDSGLIAYHHVGPKIMRHQFTKNFCRIIERAHDHFFVQASIESIDEKIEIFEIIKRLTDITKVTIYLHPSNPSHGIWKDVDDRLKKLKAVQYREEYKGKQGESLEIISDNDFNNKLTMAVDGYGSANISGKLDGQKKTIRTKDNPLTTTTYNEDTEYQNVFNDLQGKITEIFSRFMNTDS